MGLGDVGNGKVLVKRVQASGYKINKFWGLMYSMAIIVNDTLLHT